MTDNKYKIGEKVFWLVSNHPAYPLHGIQVHSGVVLNILLKNGEVGYAVDVDFVHSTRLFHMGRIIVAERRLTNRIALFKRRLCTAKAKHIKDITLYYKEQLKQMELVKWKK